MLVLEKGRYRARIAETPDDVAAAQTLRHDCFGLNHAHGLDQDAFDDLCEHMLVEDVETSDLICCYRIMHLNSGMTSPDPILRSIIICQRCNPIRVNWWKWAILH